MSCQTNLKRKKAKAKSLVKLSKLNAIPVDGEAPPKAAVPAKKKRTNACVAPRATGAFTKKPCNYTVVGCAKLGASVVTPTPITPVHATAKICKTNPEIEIDPLKHYQSLPY